MFNAAKLRSEVFRKAIHILIALGPPRAAMSRSHTALLIMGGLLFYVYAESLRFLGFQLPLFSAILMTVLRKREEGGLALGPVTLGLGALLTLLLFPPMAAAAAIYALAFGDGTATLTGRFLGRIRPAFLGGKSLEGSITCFIVSGLAGFFVFYDWKAALAIGLASMVTEALPFRDFDNLLLPLAAGLAGLAFC
jgi:dolichol kinase